MVRKIIYLGIPLAIGMMILILVGGAFLLFNLNRIIKSADPDRMAEIAEWREAVRGIQRNDTAWVAMSERYECAGVHAFVGAGVNRERLVATDDITGNRLILTVDVDRDMAVNRFVTCVSGDDDQRIHRAYGPAAVDYIMDNDCVPPQKVAELWIDYNTYLMCPGSMMNIGPIDRLTYTEEAAQIMAAHAIELYEDDPQAAFDAIQDPRPD